MPGTLSDVSHEASKLLPAVKLTRPPLSLFKFPPSPQPTALPPPPDHPNLAHPVTIPTDWYNALLHPYVPITIALVYATTATYINSVNARRNHKPWAISKTRFFKAFVILHNLILAVYSAWTFLGMLNALSLSIPNWRNEQGAAGIVDSLCKIQGPRGLGSAATFTEESRAWTMTNRFFHLAADGLGPERSDVGRLWNEGLAFYGWLFYLSKFYEVIDTAIILAKGRKSSLLQTYHHAGAMLCMWAGIRYMSPPIWMFVFVNSGIHALMYTFYLCSTLKVHIPKRLKKLLTTIQITQFVVGATYAFLHLFVVYQIPISVPYLYHVSPKVASMAASDASSIASSAVASVTGDTGAFLKKLALRAAGFEGMAENVGLTAPAASAGAQAAVPREYFAQAEERYKDELQWVNCLDTSGQVFAILLNVVYLAPLTWLFVDFFIKAYLSQLEKRRRSSASDRARIAGMSFSDASKGVARRVTQALDEMHPTADSSENESPIVESSESVGSLKKKAAQAAENTSGNLRGMATQATQNVKDTANAVGKAGSNIQKTAQDKAAPAVEATVEKVKEVGQKIQEQVPEAKAGKAKAQQAVKNANENVPSADQVKAEVEAAPKKVEDKVANTQQAAKEKAKDVSQQADEKESDAKEATKGAVDSAKADSSEAQSSSSPVTDDKSFAEAVKEEPESKSAQKESPNGDGTGADAASGSQTEESEQKEEAKKEEEKIIDESQPVRDEDKEPESGTETGKGNGQSHIPRPKKNRKKA